LHVIFFEHHQSVIAETSFTHQGVSAHLMWQKFICPGYCRGRHIKVIVVFTYFVVCS